MDDKLKRAIDRRMAGAALSEASKARILQSVAQRKGLRSVKTKRILIAAIAAAVVIATMGAGFLVWDMMNQSVSSWQSEHPDAVTKLDLSQSDAGYTVTLDAMFGDTRYLYFTGTVTRDDGEPIQVDQLENESMPEYKLSRMDFSIADYTIPNADVAPTSAISTRFLPDYDQTDNSIDFMIKMFTAADVLGNGGQASFTFDSIDYEWQGEKKEVKGNWPFSLDTTHEISGEVIHPEQTVTMPDGAIILKNIYFSPVDITMDWEGDSHTIASLMDHGAYLLLEDGTHLPIVSHWAAGWNEETKQDQAMVQFFPFNMGLGYLGPDDVKALVIGDTTVPLFE